MYYAAAQTFISLIQTKKILRNLFKSKKLFFDCIAMHQFVWLKEILFESKKFLNFISALRSKKTSLEQI